MKHELSVTSQLMMSSPLSAGSAIYLRDVDFTFPFTTLVIGLEFGICCFGCVLCASRDAVIPTSPPLIDLVVYERFKVFLRTDGLVRDFYAVPKCK